MASVGQGTCVLLNGVWYGTAFTEVIWLFRKAVTL